MEYTGDGTGLFSPVGRRVSFFDLVNNLAITFPFQLPHPVARIALSPDGHLLLAVDERGQSVLLSVPHRTVLHWMNFREPVTACKFSPSGDLLAVALGHKVQVWRTPSSRSREFAPFALERQLYGHSEAVVALDWRAGTAGACCYLLTASADMTARVYELPLAPHPKARHTEQLADKRLGAILELRGHHHPLVTAFFASSPSSSDDASPDDAEIVTVALNGSIFRWPFAPRERKTSAPKLVAPAFKGHLVEAQREQEAALEEAQAEADDSPAPTALPGDNHGEQQSRGRHSPRAKVTAVAYEREHGLVVAAFSTGIFGLFALEPFQSLYTLSLTQAHISSIAINRTGEWLALGVAEAGQLIVWEWKSESFILKQQGHAVTMDCLAYSPDGQTLATGSADGRVKLWNAQAGLCFVTFSEHTAAVSAVAFTKNGKVVVSASADGTVRAFDLLRYRNFRIMTTPTPVQFQSLAVDPTGELIAAGTLDTFEIYLWSMQTGQLLEVIAGHTGPISALAFDPVGHVLASASWDRTVRLWNVFDRNKNLQILQHSADVLDVAFRPDGQQVAAATLAGELAIWDVEEAVVLATIECRRDIADRPLSAASVRSIAYSPEGTVLLAAGQFPFIAMYDIASRILLKRFPVCKVRRDRPELTADVRVSAVRMAPTNRAFAALSGEGMMVFSLEEGMKFDPFDLEVDLTPAHIERALHEEKHYLKALVMALRLNVPAITEQVVMAIPLGAVSFLIADLPDKYLHPALSLLASLSARSPHLGLLSAWACALLNHHALRLRRERAVFAAPLRLLHKNLREAYSALGRMSNETLFMMEVLADKCHAHIDETMSVDDGAVSR